MKFSDTLGITKPKSVIQVGTMDDVLRNKLWNVFYLFFVEPLNKDRFETTAWTKFAGFFNALWHQYFEKPVDTIPQDKYRAVNELRGYFFSAEWYNVYNFIDFVFKNSAPVNGREFRNAINSVLESELSGYRYIEDNLVPISNEREINEIEDVLGRTYGSPFLGINTHIKSALSIFGNREKPDYRNVIKESISAVESAAQLISGDTSAELGKALKILKEKIQLDGALVSAYNSIYGYTSNADGIRHALSDKDNLDMEDAKYMLVSCSAFVNYLLTKAEKAGIKLT